MEKCKKNSPESPPHPHHPNHHHHHHQRYYIASVVFFNFVRPCLAEFFATMLFVFTGVLGICRASPGPAGLGRSAAALTHGFILFVLVAATARVSGGHLNPAVTLAMTICGGLIPIVLAPLYIMAQLLGGIIGAALAKVVLTSDGYDALLGGVHKLGEGVDPGQAILAEMLATSILVLAVLMVAFDDRTKTVMGPLAIGFAVTGGIIAIGSISGGSLNPARSFGPAIVRGYWKKHYVYWVGPFLGSLFASLLYGVVLATPTNLWLPLNEPMD